MPQKIVKTTYEGNYRSSTYNPLTDGKMTVNAARFTPIDLLTSAYNSCLLGTMAYVAQQNNFDVKKAQSEIEWNLSEDQTRVGSMNIKILFGNDFPEDQKSLLENAAKTLCHVGQSLNPAIEKKFEFIYNETLA